MVLVEFGNSAVLIYDMDQNNEHIWKLMGRKLSGDATKEELAELEFLLLKNPDENYSMEILADLWNSKPELKSHYAENKYKELMLHLQQLENDESRVNKYRLGDHDSRPGILKKWYLLLTSTIIIGFAFFFLKKKQESSNSAKEYVTFSKNEINTKNGSKTNMVLPDGTKVWLNAGSKLTYDNDYGINLREVNLSGEAYFDVVKNRKKPFIIHTSKINIKVLGTAFNVSCYPNEKNTETSLVRGSLEVTMKEGGGKIILKPNEKLIVSNNRIPVKLTPDTSRNIFELSRLSIMPKDNTIVETSWVNNKLVFRAETFEEVAHKMERWYGVVIVIADEKLKSEKFTGIFEKETISQALNALQITTSFSFSINNGNILIYKK